MSAFDRPKRRRLERDAERLGAMITAQLAPAVQLVGRSGAQSIDIRYQDDESPTVWMAVGTWQLDGRRVYEAAAGLTPTIAVLRLCEAVIDGGLCTHCGRPTGFSEHFDSMATGLAEFDAATEVTCWYQWDPELETFRRGCEGDHPDELERVASPIPDVPAGVIALGGCKMAGCLRPAVTVPAFGPQTVFDYPMCAPHIDAMMAALCLQVGETGAHHEAVQGWAEWMESTDRITNWRWQFRLGGAPGEDPPPLPDPFPADWAGEA